MRRGSDTPDLPRRLRLFVARLFLAGASWLRVGRLDDFEMGAGDTRPRAAGVELDIALPVLDGFAVAAVARESARQIEVGVGVVGRELERLAVVRDRLFDLAAVLVQRAEIVGRLAALRVLVERRDVRRAGFLVAA